MVGMAKDFRHPKREKPFPRPKPLTMAFCAQLQPDGPLVILYSGDYGEIEFIPWDRHFTLITHDGEVVVAYFRSNDEAIYWYRRVERMMRDARADGNHAPNSKPDEGLELEISIFDEVGHLNEAEEERKRLEEEVAQRQADERMKAEALRREMEQAQLHLHFEEEAERKRKAREKDRGWDMGY